MLDKKDKVIRGVPLLGGSANYAVWSRKLCDYLKIHNLDDWLEEGPTSLSKPVDKKASRNRCMQGSLLPSSIPFAS
jgi:hypothetical protein